MAKDVNLLSYWMPVLRQLKEFKEIAKAEEPELKALLEACDNAINNFFIPTADEYGISRFEKMLGIFPDEGDDLEIRRFNVLIKWNDKAPYTDEELYNRLFSLCGGDNFIIDRQYDKYAIDITTELGVKDAFDTVIPIVQNMIPCNLVLSIQNRIKAQKSTPTHYGVAISTAMSYQITNDLYENTVSVGNSPVGTSMSTVTVVTIN